MSSSDSESGSGPKAKTSKTSHRSQKFRKAWLDVPDYKTWLRPVPNNELKGQCVLCKTEFVAELTNIKKHLNSAKHKTTSKIKQSTKTSILQKFVQAGPSSSSAPDAVKEAEIKLCAFVSDHHISFRTLDHLCPLLSKVFPDSQIAKDLSLRRTKARNIVVNVIAKSHKNDLSMILKTQKFSVLVDESTDIAVTKTACIVVRYFDVTLEKVETSLWELVPMFKEGEDIDHQGTAQHFFQIIIESFVNHQIPVENIIGFASDGCNMMMGQHNSVASRFTELCPGIVIFKCICHSLHLCCSQACKCLPRTCEDLARNIYSFFKSSSKRQCDFKQFQKFAEVEVHKLLHPSQTRWLSLAAVVSRILEQWPALQIFFNQKYLEERLLATEQIHQGLNDPFVKLYFLFLNYVLPKITNLNQYFQSDKVLVINLHTSIVEKYTELLLCFMENKYVRTTPLSQIDPKNQTFFLPYPNMYLGVDIMNEIKTMDIQNRPDSLKYFYERCREFYSVLCTEIKKRYDFDDVILSQLHIFSKKNALSSEIRDRYPSLHSIFEHLHRFHAASDRQLIDDEWRLLPNFHFPPETHVNPDEDIDQFWGKLLNFRNENGAYVFHNLSSFILNILSLPHSNAACERVFSNVNSIKTKSRNRLITTTMNGILLSKQCVNKSEGCVKFSPNNDMLSRMTKAQLYEQKPSTSFQHKVVQSVLSQDVDSDEFEIDHND